MTKELLKGKEITIGREQLREMGFPVSDEKYEPQPGIYRVDSGSVTIVLTDDFKPEQMSGKLVLTPEQWEILEKVIRLTLDEGNSESTIEWQFNSEFADIRELERDVFISDLKHRLSRDDHSI
jgi:hypothetical protein